MLADHKCKHCGQKSGNGKITMHCPRTTIKPQLLVLVEKGELDYKDGDWINAKPGKTGVTFIESLTEFMQAIESELAPDVTDELTNEDTDLLKIINSVPLPAVIVSELNLPVDQLVSLHKLKRLNYVNIFGGSSDQVIKYHYKTTNKGNKFLNSLEPKPVKLDNIDSLFLMVHIYKNKSVAIPSRLENAFEWLQKHTSFIYPDCNKHGYYMLTEIGKEFIDEILSKELLFI